MIFNFLLTRLVNRDFLFGKSSLKHRFSEKFFKKLWLWDTHYLVSGHPGYSCCQPKKQVLRGPIDMRSIMSRISMT